MNPIALAERGLVPDFLIRSGIRRLLRRRLAGEQAAGKDTTLDPFFADLRQRPIAEETDKANEQHYELPAAYFTRVLGPRLKYSSGYWESRSSTLAESEDAMLRLSCERAQLEDGQQILELGCGWGSLSLWMASHYPNANITAVSNSNSQRAFILERAQQQGLDNLSVVTCDMNGFQPQQRFDRVVSVEMFEHMKNYAALLQRIHDWLQPGGKLFVHIFTHRLYAYHFDDAGDANDWMARYFFSGGTMPSDDLLLHFQDHLRIDGHWRVNGTHYSRTLEAWLRLQDAAQGDILPLFTEVYGDAASARIWIHRWRLFYLACSELFRFRGGNEWLVSHYRFTKPTI
jgi:cyclopropane-fatty-acyl-phospholipid synthase